MEVIMRIRRTILAPVVLAIGTIGALAASPAITLTTVAAPVGAAVSAGATPSIVIMHG
jgi:hypothetical protein